MNSTARAEARIKQLCCLGLPSESIMPTLLTQMHGVISGYAYNFFWVGDDVQVTNVYHENFDEVAPLLPHYLSEFCNQREGEVLPSFAEAIRNERGVKTIEESLKVDPRVYRRHDYYNEIVFPVHYRDSMRLVVRERGHAVGAIVVHRDHEEGRFSMQDKQHLASIAPFIAHAVDTSDRARAQDALIDSGASGLIIVNRHCKMEYISPDAQRLLFLATHPAVSTTTITQAYDNVELPDALRRICRNLVDVFEGRQVSAAPPVWHHRNPWGGFSSHAHWLNNNRLNNGGGTNGAEPVSSPLIGITIQHEVPLTVRLIAALARFALSRRQMDICLLLAADHPHAEIARRMGMSTHTVTTHVRRIYDKLGVHNKAELMNKLLNA